MELAAEAIEAALERRQIDVAACAAARRRQSSLTSSDGACTLPHGRRKVWRSGREAPHDQQAALTDWGSAVCIGRRNPRRAASTHAEKDEPQPQDLVEFGLMKLKPWRMSVSS